MAKTDREERLAELNEKLPWLDGDLDYLRRALRHMSIVWPDRAERIGAFSLYYGLGGESVQHYAEIGRRFGRTGSWASQACWFVRNRLINPMWHDEAAWPEPKVRRALSTMGPVRVGEIAAMVEAWRYQGTGTQRYVFELHMAAEELNIPESEMREFFNAIADRLMQRK